MQHPKVVIIGAGSIFFGRQAIWQMVHSPHLRGGTLALVDKQPVHLARMAELARRAIADAKVKLALEASTDRRAALKGADFVVLSFADHSVKCRRIDCEIALKYGIRMCSGDTIGPGGIMRTLRELPVILQCCRDIEDLCPEAWVINYINPTAANGKGIRILKPRLRSFALCDGLHMPHVKRRYAQLAGILGPKGVLTPALDRRFDLRIAGPNHFTWVLKAALDGRDVTPAMAARLRRDAEREFKKRGVGAKALLNSAISAELYNAFGCVPACTGHTKEYVRFWQGLGKTPEPIPPLAIWEDHNRYERHADVWNQVDGFNSGVIPIGDFHKIFGPDHATDIIETMWAGLGKPFYINTENRGAVNNMADDCFMELLSDVGMHKGPLPRPVGAAPVGLRGLWQQVLDTHELTARAAATGDRDLLFRAFVCDPIVSSLADSRAMIRELLEAEKEYLPSYWFKKAPRPRR